MKTRPLAFALLTLCGAVWTSAADDYVRESSWAGETFTSKVIKDLSFKDDGAEYVAYLVRWKDHDIVVTAPLLLKEHYAAGDSVRCQMMRSESKHDGVSRSEIRFMLANELTNDARLQAISDEVNARRAARQKAMGDKLPAKAP